MRKSPGAAAPEPLTGAPEEPHKRLPPHVCSARTFVRDLQARLPTLARQRRKRPSHQHHRPEKVHLVHAGGQDAIKSSSRARSRHPCCREGFQLRSKPVRGHRISSFNYVLGLERNRVVVERVNRLLDGRRVCLRASLRRAGTSRARLEIALSGAAARRVSSGLAAADCAGATRMKKSSAPPRPGVPRARERCIERSACLDSRPAPMGVPLSSAANISSRRRWEAADPRSSFDRESEARSWFQRTRSACAPRRCNWEQYPVERRRICHVNDRVRPTAPAALVVPCSSASDP